MSLLLLLYFDYPTWELVINVIIIMMNYDVRIAQFQLVVFSLFIFLIIELVLNIMSFNMVTRGNAMANKSSQSVGSKRSYTHTYIYYIIYIYQDCAAKKYSINNSGIN